MTFFSLRRKRQRLLTNEGLLIAVLMTIGVVSLLVSYLRAVPMIERLFGL